MEVPPPDLTEWAEITRRAAETTETVKIALVGKYVALQDAYLSVSEALRHSGFHHDCRVEIDWVDSESLENDAAARQRLADADGILIPGGFGGRGIEGKICAARVARELRIPYLGICLGMQIAVAEFARHVAGMDGANSTEFDPETPHPVIDLLPEQKEVTDLGGTMRLGADPVKIHAGTRARDLYGEAVIYERHRHRYEVNLFLRKRLEAAGLDRQRHVTRRAPRRDDRARRPPVLRRIAVSSGVQVAPGAPRAAVPRLRRRRAGSRPRSRRRPRVPRLPRVAPRRALSA